jgi:hypothetical protein
MSSPLYSLAKEVEEEIEVEVKGDLSTCCGSLDKSKGEVEREVEMEGTVLKKDELKAKVKIYLPALGVGVTDLGTARSADVGVVFTRGAVDYAECFLKFDKIKKEREDGATVDEAEYKLDLRAKAKKKGTLRIKQKKGVCDVDLATPGIQPGLPEMLDGDVVTAQVNGFEILQGFVEIDDYVARDTALIGGRLNSLLVSSSEKAGLLTKIVRQKKRKPLELYGSRAFLLFL